MNAIQMKWSTHSTRNRVLSKLSKITSSPSMDPILMFLINSEYETKSAEKSIPIYETLMKTKIYRPGIEFLEIIDICENQSVRWINPFDVNALHSAASLNEIDPNFQKQLVKIKCFQTYVQNISLTICFFEEYNVHTYTGYFGNKIEETLANDLKEGVHLYDETNWEIFKAHPKNRN